MMPTNVVFGPVVGVRRARWSILFALAILLGLLPDRLPAEQPQRELRVHLAAFVNWDYRDRQKLRGWMATATVVARSLALWHPRGFHQELVTNGDPAQLSRFFASLPGEGECDLSVVYLASHQSRDTFWHFTQGTAADWGALLRGVPRHPRRLIVLDACFAARVREHPAWREMLPGTWLFTCGPSEEVFEVSVRRRRPLDLSRRHPEATHWLEAQLGPDWDGRISFAGFIWACAFLETPAPPRTREDWNAFFRRCETMAHDVEALGVRRFASEISHVESP